MADVGRCGQLGGQELLIGVPVGGHHLEQEIRLPGQHVALAHLGPVTDGGLEGFQVRFGLRRKPDLGEDGNVEAERLGIQVGVITEDIAGFLQGPDAPQAWRRRNAGAARQLHIGDSAIGLKVVEDAAVDPVEFDPLHDSFPVGPSSEI